MNPELRILHLEDNEDDALFLHALLREQGIVCQMERVQSREAFLAALERGECDLILSDFTIPGFGGLAALALAREKRPEVPFLFISGTVGEDIAIDSLKRGATDYVLKDRPARLVPAIRRALAEAEKQRVLRKAEEAMIQSEFKYRQLFECLADAAILADATSGRVLDANNQAEALLDRTRAEIIGANQNQFLSTATLEEYRRRFAGDQPVRTTFEGEVLAKAGRAIPVSVSAATLLLHGRRLILGLYRDRA